MLPLSAIFESQILRIQQQLRQPYQPVGQPVLRPRGREVPLEAHGTRSGYKAYGCRCLRCKAAISEYSSRMRRQQREKVRAADRQKQIDFFGSMREAS